MKSLAILSVVLVFGSSAIAQEQPDQNAANSLSCTVVSPVEGAEEFVAVVDLEARSVVIDDEEFEMTAHSGDWLFSVSEGQKNEIIAVFALRKRDGAAQIAILGGDGGIFGEGSCFRPIFD